MTTCATLVIPVLYIPALARARFLLLAPLLRLLTQRVSAAT